MTTNYSTDFIYDSSVTIPCWILRFLLIFTGSTVVNVDYFLGSYPQSGLTGSEFKFLFLQNFP